MAFPNKQTQFQPGQSGNPDGSSRKQRLTTALIKAIEEKGLDDPFVKVGLAAALKGDFKFWSYIFDRVDGKLTDPTEHDSNDDQATETKQLRLTPVDQRSAPRKRRSPARPDD